jgi:hypothetical protein
VACAQAVGLIISGIITATAAHLTEKARQRNISFAGQSMAAIGAAMSAAAIQQPPHQFASDGCCAASSNTNSEAGGFAAAQGTGSFKRSNHARGMSVSWDAAAGGSAKSSGLGSSLHVRIDEADAEQQQYAAGSLSPGADSAAHQSQYGLISPGGLQADPSSGWTLHQTTTQQSDSFGGVCGGSSSSCSSPAAAARRSSGWSSGGGNADSPDCPANSLSGGKAAAAAAAVGYGSTVDGEVRWLMDSSEGDGAAAAGCYRSSLNPAGLVQEQDVAAEAQLALAELQSDASTVGVGRASFGRQLLGQQGSAVSMAAGSHGAAAEGKDAGDADGLDLDDADGPESSNCKEASWAAGGRQSQPGSMPGSPKRAGSSAAAAAGGFGLQGSNSSSSGGQQQQQPGAPVSPSGRASLAVSRSSSRRDSVAADGGGGVYSVLSELDLSQNPLGATGAKVVAEVRACLAQQLPWLRLHHLGFHEASCRNMLWGSRCPNKQLACCVQFCNAA